MTVRQRGGPAMVERRGDDAALGLFLVACLREFCDFGLQDGVHGARAVKLMPWWREFVGSVDRLGKLITDRREHLPVDGRPDVARASWRR